MSQNKKLKDYKKLLKGNVLKLMLLQLLLRRKRRNKKRPREKD